MVIRGRYAFCNKTFSSRLRRWCGRLLYGGGKDPSPNLAQSNRVRLCEREGTKKVLFTPFVRYLRTKTQTVGQSGVSIKIKHPGGHLKRNHPRQQHQTGIKMTYREASHAGSWYTDSGRHWIGSSTCPLVLFFFPFLAALLRSFFGFLIAFWEVVFRKDNIFLMFLCVQLC